MDQGDQQEPQSPFQTFRCSLCGMVLPYSKISYFIMMAPRECITVCLECDILLWELEDDTNHWKLDLP